MQQSRFRHKTRQETHRTLFKAVVSNVAFGVLNGCSRLRRDELLVLTRFCPNKQQRSETDLRLVPGFFPHRTTSELDQTQQQTGDIRQVPVFGQNVTFACFSLI